MNRATLAFLAVVALAPAARAFPGDVTREDLAFAYTAFETAYADHPPAADRLADVNRRFDSATLSFFAGHGPEALRGLADLTAFLLGEASPEAALARSLFIRVEPRVLVAGAKELPVLSFGAFYAVKAPPEAVRGLSVAIVGPGGRRLDTGLVPDGSGALPSEAAALPPGLYEVRVEGPGGLSVARARLAVVPRPLATMREENAAAIAALPGGVPPAVLASLSERNALLADPPSPSRSAEFLTDPAALAAEVAAGIALVRENGRGPGAGPGDHWLALPLDGAPMPYRLVVPDRAADGPMPLLIALHGAGGDENMFRWGYGSGLLPRLAAQRGFLLATPLTTRFSTDPAVFDRLVEAIAADHPVDRRRILLLGHSLGAMAAGIAARARRDTVAGLCLIAGLPPGRTTGLPPRIVFEGALDPLRGSRKPMPELEVVRDHGHTLLVTTVLPRAVDWLLEQRLPE